jgi:type I restriction enzyme R subunit
LKKQNHFAKSNTIVRDNGDNLYFEFLNTEHWCQNQYQVTNQVSQEGKFKNRYDVTILINGLPLVQIELKRRGLELERSVQSNQSLSTPFIWGKWLCFNMFKYSLSAMA